MPPYGPPPQADITTPEKEEILLSPMRIPRSRKSPAIHQWRQVILLYHLFLINYLTYFIKFSSSML